MRKDNGRRKGPGPDPVRGINGFVMFLTGIVCFVIYVVWAFVPPSWLEILGLTYWPSRYWAVVLPVYVTFVSCVVFILIAATNLRFTPPITSYQTVQDSPTIIPTKNEVFTEDIPPIADTPIDDFCRRQYTVCA